MKKVKEQGFSKAYKRNGLGFLIPNITNTITSAMNTLSKVIVLEDHVDGTIPFTQNPNKVFKKGDILKVLGSEKVNGVNMFKAVPTVLGAYYTNGFAYIPITKAKFTNATTPYTQTVPSINVIAEYIAPITQAAVANVNSQIISGTNQAAVNQATQLADLMTNSQMGAAQQAISQQVATQAAQNVVAEQNVSKAETTTTQPNWIKWGGIALGVLTVGFIGYKIIKNKKTDEKK